MSPGKNDALDTSNVRDSLGGTFAKAIQQDVGEFITSFCRQECSFRNIINHHINTVTMCRSCGMETTSRGNINYILSLSVPTANKKPHSLQEIIDDNIITLKSMKSSCST